MSAAAPLSDDAMRRELIVIRNELAYIWPHGWTQKSVLVSKSTLGALLACWDAAHPTPPAAVPAGERPARHVCGAQGFGRGIDGLNDRCSACEAALAAQGGADDGATNV